MQETLWWRSISGPLVWEHRVIKPTSMKGAIESRRVIKPRCSGAPGAGRGAALVLGGQLVQLLQFRLCSSVTTRKRHGISYQVGEGKVVTLNATMVDDADTLGLFLGQHDWLLAAPVKYKPEAAKETAVQDEASAADICLWPWNQSGPGWSQIAQTYWLLKLTVSETNTHSCLSYFPLPPSKKSH